jgi:hypothetical protein
MIAMVFSLISLFISCMAFVVVSVFASRHETSIIQKGDNNEARINWSENN